ncbi:MAG: endolytic transglycosylase MltG [Chromatiales bacterium]|nr:endolytic transglycosylase MltG [Chromatiales bacterium]
MRRGMRFVVVLLICLTSALGGGWLYLNSMMNSPGSRTAPVSLEVTPGSSVRRIAANLEQIEVVDSSGLFEAYVRAKGLATQIQAGEYLIVETDSPRDVLQKMVDGRVLLHSVTLVEGWTYWEMLERLSQIEVLTDDVSSLEAEELMSLMGAPGSHPEGRFFPDTYHVPRGTAASKVLALAMQRMEDELTQAWNARDPDLPLEDPYQVLILASVVEKETALASERPTIAGVFSRRLQKRMRLQTDPTVIYGIGQSFDGNLRKADLERDGPYNTYTRRGLPPTPICIPGREALLAAARPAEGRALYFVATGEDDGSHYFSATLEEHNQAVARYLKKLRQKRREQR